MQAIKEQITKALRESVSQVIGENGELDIKLEHPVDESFGDYSTNIALVASKNSPFSSPMELAEKLVEHLSSDSAIKNIAKISVIKPGFINFHLEEQIFSEELQLALKQKEHYGCSSANTADRNNSMPTMVLDHSHPNIAKRFGIGHLRSTIIGQAIINMYRFIGWNVVSTNFLGDWGTQFGSLIAAIKEENLDVNSLTIDDLEKIYVEFNKKAKENPEIWKKAQQEFKKLEDGDSTNREIWEQVKKVSMVEFERVWNLLGTEFDHIHPESFFEDKMSGVIQDAKDKQLAEEDQGALIIRVEGFEAPLLLVKSDGATTYETRDLAAIKYWVKEFNPDVIAYEVGSEQAQHFQLVFSVAEKLGYISKDKLVHIQHGLYLGKDGKKMRTRTGDTVRLEEVLDEAVERVTKKAWDKIQETTQTHFEGQYVYSSKDARVMPAEQLDVAQKIGVGAIKYFDLSHQPSTNIVFDWEKVFQMDGNSAPYLQYTNVRTISILDKAGEWKYEGMMGNISEEEQSVLRHFYKFGEVVEQAAKSYSPNLVCTFLFELAQRYNAFYNKHRILEAESENQKNFRLALTQVTGNILKNGLNLLGIQAPERM